jgi:ABC-type phosphate transport system substrate-binding protein
MVALKIRSALLGTCAMAALVLASANSAKAQITQINGGGSTLAQITYGAIFNAYQTNLDPTVNFNYAGVGSGDGQRGLLCNDAAQGAGWSGPPIYFGASDAALNSTQVTNWNASTAKADGATACQTDGGTTGAAQGGPLIQVPTFGTPITLPFNLPGQTKNGQIQLTDDQICRIFSGLVTTWNTLPGPAVNTTGTAPTGPITVIYRSDGSGTTFLFTQHLAAACTPGTNTPTGFTFAATQTFANLFPGGTPPGNFAGAKGSAGVQAAIGLDGTNHRPRNVTSGTSGAIGYLSPDYTTIAPTNEFATTTFPPVAAVLNSIDVGAGYQFPNISATTLALSQGVPPTTNAQLKDPTQYVPPVANPAHGYPIVGYTAMILPTCFANSYVGFTMIGVLSELYSDANFIGLVQQNGFSPLPTNLLTPISQNILNNNPQTNVDIENAGICQSNGGSTYAGR